MNFNERYETYAISNCLRSEEEARAPFRTFMVLIMTLAMAPPLLSAGGTAGPHARAAGRCR